MGITVVDHDMLMLNRNSVGAGNIAILQFPGGHCGVFISLESNSVGITQDMSVSGIFYY